MTRASVIKNWTQSFDPALKVAQGDQVFSIKKATEKWIGWVWCRDENGLSGWLPQQVFDTLKIGETNSITNDFDTIELTVSTGETLSIYQQLNAWTWCKNDRNQEGWVPDECLSLPNDAA